MPRSEDFNALRLAEYLQGTCNSLDSALEELYPGMEFTDLTSDDHSVIDNEVFRCEECDWWHEISDQSQSDDTKCKECSPDDED